MVNAMEMKLSVQFSCSVVSNSLQPYGLQHIRFPCPLPSPRACSNSCSLSQWWMPSNHLIFFHPLFLLLSIFPSISVFSNESVLQIWWLKYWSFSFSVSLSNKYSGLISFRIGWLDLLAVQGTLKSLLQHKFKSIKFFGAQHSSWSNFHIHAWLFDKPELWLDRSLSAK